MVLVDAQVVRLSAPVVVETHVSVWLVVTTFGNELTLCENEVITVEDTAEPNNVRVGLGLQAIVEMSKEIELMGCVMCRHARKNMNNHWRGGCGEKAGGGNKR